MRRYDDPVDVRQKPVAGISEAAAPQQFLWHGRLFVVRDVLAHWVETGAWWRSPSARLVYGMADDTAESGRCGGVSDGGASNGGGEAVDETGEREVWRVEASAGRAMGSGVYDLSFAVGPGVWRLTRALD